MTARLSGVTTDWILAWRDDICHQAKENLRVPPYCKKDLVLLDQLLTAFVVYDALSGESITMRAFSGKCYQNTKTFEREVRDSFLRIALSYCAGLIEACEHSELGEREQLAYLVMSLPETASSKLNRGRSPWPLRLHMAWRCQAQVLTPYSLLT